MDSLIVGWGILFLWGLVRLYATKSRNFKFDWHGVHHLDGGFGILIVGVMAGSLWTLLLGVLFIIDDLIGHWRSARGKPEKFILEWVSDWALKYFYRFVDGK